MREVAETLTEDNYRPLAVEPLNPLELKVKAHWQRFQPETSKSLGKKLDLMVRKTVHRVEFEISLANTVRPCLY